MVVDQPSPRQPFSQAAFERWALATHDKSPDSVKYYMSRLRAMLRLGLDVDVFLSSPDAGADQAERLMARVKARDRYSAHVGRNYGRVLNWLCAYAEHLDDGKREWKRRPLPKQPPAVPKTVEAPDLAVLWSYQGPDPYTTLLRRAIAEVALAGNFRRRELGTLRLRHLKPETGQIELVRAGKGSISGLVEVPWTLYWPESALLQYLSARAPVKGEGRDALWTTPFGGGRPLSPASVYKHLREMGKELGIPLSFIRTKRRSLTDADRQIRDLRITQAKSRHVKVDNLMTYLGRIDGPTVRTALANANVPGFDLEAKARAVPALPGPSSTRHEEDQDGKHEEKDGSDAPVHVAGAAAPVDAVGVAQIDGRGFGRGGLGGGSPRRGSDGAQGHAVQGGRGPEAPGADAPQGDDGQDGRQERDHDDEEHAAAEGPTETGHAIPPPPDLFPLSPSPLAASKNDGGMSPVAGVVAPVQPASLSTPPGLFPQGVTERMSLQTLVSKAGRLDRPSALVSANRSAPLSVKKIPMTGKALTSASPADNTCSVLRDGRPEAGVDAPAPELPRHGIPAETATVTAGGDLGTFTRTGVVAPSGSSPAATPSRYPATRRALRHEVSAAAAKGGC